MTSDRKRPTAVCVESTARYDELVSVCGTQTKPKSDVRGCEEMVCEVPRCLTVKIQCDTVMQCPSVTNHLTLPYPSSTRL